jgi:general secretion pathway protein D
MLSLQSPFPNRRFAVCALLLLLAGCAGQQAYREGHQLLADNSPDKGLAKLEEAVRLEPKNAEYRIALARRGRKSLP